MIATKQQQRRKIMSKYVDCVKNDEDLPISYSINVEAISTSKRPLTCYITTDAPRILKEQTINQLNHTKRSVNLETINDRRIKPLENTRQSSIHLPVTYSTSIHIPCHPPTIKSRPSTILPLQSTHHYHHYYHYYHHRQRPPIVSSRPSTIIKHKNSLQHVSTSSTRPSTPTTTTDTSSESLSPILKRSNKNINLTSPISTSNRVDKQLSYPSPPCYSTLIWKWFHHTPTKSQSYPKGSQSDYSEVYQHELPNKRNLLFKFFPSSTEKQSKSKRQHTCFTRKYLRSSSSSSSLPNKYTNYNE
ncbi:unnamed protein product [Adineta steineri]|uniref:Uncharacterized protein n=1 Tax=Adineta steineri TaxID=433720 RepID=A0A818V1W5_9BILA|nr:unnamed protein product [Adineta steineri]CAF3706400.1 unnamed protein product [Adineta steineri]